MPKEKQKFPVEPTLPAKSHARLYRKMLQKKNEMQYLSPQKWYQPVLYSMSFQDNSTMYI